MESMFPSSPMPAWLADYSTERELLQVYSWQLKGCARAFGKFAAVRRCLAVDVDVVVFTRTLLVIVPELLASPERRCGVPLTMSQVNVVVFPPVVRESCRSFT